MLKNRRSRLKPFFADYALDAVLLTDLRNIRYLCGFSGSEGALLVARDSAWFLCDSRYTAQAGEEVQSAEVVECVAVRLDTVASLAAENGLNRIGFEAAHTTVSAYRRMTEKLSGIELVELDSKLDEIRICKDTAEVGQLKSIAVLASQSFEAILGKIKPGVRELDVAFALEFEMRQRGADGKAFDFIVASGMRGAMPHGRASDKVIQSGDLITIDFGALKDGYHSDETVTVACGQPSSEALEIHAIVKTAHDLAIDAVKPGISCKALDEVARSFIRGKGYGDCFGHGLGHGIGLEIHEMPTLSPRSTMVLEEGMTVTIEPGIYIPGFGGVRIEDSVVVTSDGCALLTGVGKRLLVL
ncbi:MAG: Xaa-Pro peptidase family protein [Desulfuromonadaceae bacterium]|nr:Xaa-Pro peptidase family protein [Desulfuromonadaceae bacterium]MDD5107096.1 Xaa-Pro peptidase family protein [Desulfuromonadaceae bacterium]